MKKAEREQKSRLILYIDVAGAWLCYFSIVRNRRQTVKWWKGLRQGKATPCYNSLKSRK